MAPLDPVEIGRVLDQVAAGSDGALLESLMVTLFTAIPGVSRFDQDRLSAGRNEELDLAFRNTGEAGGLVQFGPDLLVECKSQGKRVDAQAVNWFANRDESETRKGRSPHTSSLATPLSTSCHPQEKTTIDSGPDAGDILAWRSVWVDSGWCTNGSIITSWNGIGSNQAITVEGDLMSLCWSGNSVTGWSWENSAHSWLHARNWQDYGPGVSYIGCVADQPVDPVRRIAGNGYSDAYSDY